MPAPIGAEDLYRFRWIDHVRLSRDGERIAYTLSWADQESRQNRSRVVVRRVLDPEPVDVTAGPRRDHSPEWAPDGHRLTFVSRRGPADQVFMLDLGGGGDAVQLSSLSDGAGSPAWSPDGSQIAFIGSVVSDPEGVVDDPRPPDSKEQLRRSPVARVARRLDYKHDGSGFVDGRYGHLFVVPAGGGTPRQLTSGSWDVTGFDWSPDGSRLVVTGNAGPEAERDLRREQHLYTVDLEGNLNRIAGDMLLSSPAWSPRGDLIAFVAPNGMHAGLIERLWVVPVTGGAPRCLTLNLDQAVSDSVITDMRAGHGFRLCWSAEGDRLYFQVSAPGTCAISSADLEGNLRQEVGGQRRIFDFDAVPGVIAFCATDPSNPGELHIITGGAEARLTDLNPWLRDRYIALPERSQFTSPDGWVLEGWLLKPDGFDAGRRYPLVMEIHGGPHGQYGWAFFHEFQVLAGMGYMVFYLNPRGSDGYGETFRSAVVRDWGGKDYIDLMSSLDQLVERSGAVDKARMGVGGGSYGGYMTNWVVGHTDRFAAAVSMRSISNLVSEYSQHDIVIWGSLELGPPPWPDLDELWRRSPIRYVNDIKTPLMLTCGEMDLRCAISQSEELFGALRLLGKTVEMVRFPEESHDLSRGGRPDRRVERLRRIAGWFERFLGTRPSEPVAEAVVEPAVEPKAEPVAEAVVEPVAQVAAEPQPVGVATSTAEIAVPLAPPHPADMPTASIPILVPEPAVPAAPVAPAPQPEPEPEPMRLLEAPEELPLLEAGEPPRAAPPQALNAATEPLEPEPVAPEEPTAAPEVVQPVAELAPAPPVVMPAAMPEPASEPPAPEPLAAEPMAPPPVHEPAGAMPEPASEPPAPEPLAVPTPVEPEPQPVPTQAATNPVAETVVAWPTASVLGGPGNGSPGLQSDEATALMPAWPPAPAPIAEPAPDGPKTMSLKVPPEVLGQQPATAYAALLAFEAGPFAGRTVGLGDDMVMIGRAPDNDVVIADPATSGRHCRIDRRAGTFWISDLGSTNGTMVNGEPVVERQLIHGDLLAIGRNAIRFTLQ